MSVLVYFSIPPNLLALCPNAMHNTETVFCKPVKQSIATSTALKYLENATAHNDYSKEMGSSDSAHPQKLLNEHAVFNIRFIVSILCHCTIVN